MISLKLSTMRKVLLSKILYKQIHVFLKRLCFAFFTLVWKTIFFRASEIFVKVFRQNFSIKWKFKSSLHYERPIHTEKAIYDHNFKNFTEPIRWSSWFTIKTWKGYQSSSWNSSGIPQHGKLVVKRVKWRSPELRSYVMTCYNIVNSRRANFSERARYFQGKSTLRLPGFHGCK